MRSTLMPSCPVQLAGPRSIRARSPPHGLGTAGHRAYPVVPRCGRNCIVVGRPRPPNSVPHRRSPTVWFAPFRPLSLRSLPSSPMACWTSQLGWCQPGDSSHARYQRRAPWRRRPRSPRAAWLVFVSSALADLGRERRARFRPSMPDMVDILATASSPPGAGLVGVVLLHGQDVPHAMLADLFIVHPYLTASPARLARLALPGPTPLASPGRGLAHGQLGQLLHALQLGLHGPQAVRGRPGPHVAASP